MLSCFRNCLCFCKIKDSNGKQKGKNMEEIFIRGHAHAFYYHEQKKRGSPYECNACRQSGFGDNYSCSKDSCNFHYHKCCGDFLKRDSPSTAPVSNHPPYPTGRYIFEERAPRKVRYCVACGDQVQGLRYKVWHDKAHGSSNPYWRLYQHLNNRPFHPPCASLPAQMQAPGKQEFVLDLKEEIQGECLICNGIAKGWAYNSKCGDYCYHVGCVKKILLGWQQDEASQNGGMKIEVTIHLDIGLPQILEIAEVAIQLITGALLGIPFPSFLNIFRVLFHIIPVRRHSR